MVRRTLTMALPFRLTRSVIKIITVMQKKKSKWHRNSWSDVRDMLNPGHIAMARDDIDEASTPASLISAVAESASTAALDVIQRALAGNTPVRSRRRRHAARMWLQWTRDTLARSAWDGSAVIFEVCGDEIGKYGATDKGVFLALRPKVDLFDIVIH